MFRQFRRRLTFANVCSLLALTIALGTGSAYAANTVFSTDIVDGEVKSVDIGSNQVANGDLAPDSVGTGKILAGGVTGSDLGADAVEGSKVLNGSLTGSDVAAGSLFGDDISNSTLTGSDIADSSLTGADVATGSLTGADIANDSVTAADLDAADRSGSISLSPIANGRCVTVNGNVTGAQPGDVAVLTTNGSIPSGVTIYAQRARTNAVDIKACNLSGATSPAINDLPVRVLTIH